jgi:hypothetical protein
MIIWLCILTVYAVLGKRYTGLAAAEFKEAEKLGIKNE